MDWFLVKHLDNERLLANWRWLCPAPEPSAGLKSMTLVARNAFAGLFLRDAEGQVFYLDVALGQLTRVADSEAHFRELAATPEKREEWFAESDERAAAERGLKPDLNQCIGYSIPLIFKESGFPGNAYVTDIYDQVSFLGNLHHQVATLPDGTKVRLRVVD